VCSSDLDAEEGFARHRDRHCWTGFHEDRSTRFAEAGLAGELLLSPDLLRTARMLLI